MAFEPIAEALRGRRVRKFIDEEAFRKYAAAEAGKGARWARRPPGGSYSAIEVDLAAAIACGFAVSPSN